MTVRTRSIWLPSLPMASAFGDPGQDVPVEFLALGSLAQADFAVVELAAQLVAVVAGVVVDFLQRGRGLWRLCPFAVAGVVAQFVEIADELGCFSEMLTWRCPGSKRLTSRMLTMRTE
jgi:hypothetical protein